MGPVDKKSLARRPRTDAFRLLIEPRILGPECKGKKSWGVGRNKNLLKFPLFLLHQADADPQALTPASTWPTCDHRADHCSHRGYPPSPFPSLSHAQPHPHPRRPAGRPASSSSSSLLHKISTHRSCFSGSIMDSEVQRTLSELEEKSCGLFLDFMTR